MIVPYEVFNLQQDVMPGVFGILEPRKESARIFKPEDIDLVIVPGADEISGGTFSVTNTGSLGTLFDTPVIPAPQAAILATCAIVKRAVVVTGPNGEDVISVRPVCFLPLSYDHRLVDGADAARFLQTVTKRIEAGAFEADLGL